jgi:hypothetical protein
MSHRSKYVEPESVEMERQQQRPRRPSQIHVGDCVVAVRHAELGDARVYDGYSIRVNLIQAGQGRPFADTTWEAQLDFAAAGGAPWYLPLAQIEQAAILLATARLQPSIPMSVMMLRRDAAASWRVIVRKPYDGWD